MRTFIGGTTISNDSSPAARTAGPIISTFESISRMLWLKRKFRTPPATRPSSTKKRSVARHAGEHFFVGIDFADVPEARDQDAALGRAHHFVHRRFAAAENQIHGRFAHIIGQGETVAGGLGLHFFGGGARVDQIARHALIDQQNFLARNSFAVKGRAGLQRVIDVVADA